MIGTPNLDSGWVRALFNLRCEFGKKQRKSFSVRGLKFNFLQFSWNSHCRLRRSKVTDGSEVKIPITLQSRDPECNETIVMFKSEASDLGFGVWWERRIWISVMFLLSLICGVNLGMIRKRHIFHPKDEYGVKLGVFQGKNLTFSDCPKIHTVGYGSRNWHRNPRLRFPSHSKAEIRGSWL